MNTFRSNFAKRNIKSINKRMKIQMFKLTMGFQSFPSCLISTMELKK